MSKIIVLLVMLVFLGGCGGSDSGDKVEGNFDSKYYGQWLRVDTDEKINILHSTIIENYDIESDNLIKVNQDATTYYLMRAGLSNIIVKGLVDNIESVSSTKKAPSRIGGVNVVLENVLDPNIKESVETDNDGSFKTSSLPAGTYKFKLDDKSISNITISKPIEDIGTYKLTGDNLHNFKAELILDDEFLYADEKIHKGKIRVHNISEQVGYGLYYTLNIKDNSLKSFSNELIKGSIEPKKYIDIPISLSFNKITKNSKTITVDVNIADVENHQWKDSFSFTLYKGYFYVNIATEEDRVKGYIIMPQTHKIKNVNIQGYGTIKLPLVSADKYHLLLSNTSFEDETAYSIGINTAIKSFKNFNATSAHEPNNSEYTASNIALNESIVSYLHVTDLDYWKIAMPESKYLFDFNLESFKMIRADKSEIVTSNTLTITDKFSKDENITAELDNGILIVNGVEQNSTKVVVHVGDNVAIKLQASSSGIVSVSTFYISHYSFNFIVIVDTIPPKFKSTKTTFNLISKNKKVVGKVKAIDTEKIKYSIDKNQYSKFFSINSSSGTISFKTKPTYKENLNYTIKVKATDTHKNFTTQDVTIKYSRYTRDKIGIVKDDYTGYMWQDNTLVRRTRNAGRKYCQALVLGGYIDWKLPFNETIFLEIMKTGNKTGKIPTISPVFQNAKSAKYWVSYWSDRSPAGYFVDFATGDTGNENKDNNNYIRCYRNGK